MDTGTTDLSDFRAQLQASEQEAYVRALLRHAETGWQLHHAWALIGTEPPGWIEQAWLYDQLAFAASVVPARNLTALCTGTAGSMLTLSGLAAAVPAARGPVNWTRRPSFARHDQLLLPWPATDCTIAPDAYRDVPHQILVGQGPSFPEPQSAWRAFSEGDFSLSGASAPPQHLALLRFASLAGRIGQVHVTATEVTAEVDGRDVAGCDLELFGEASRSTRRLDGPGVISFQLEQGLPASAWLWLKRGTAWLDYRSLDPASGWTMNLARAGVEFDRPVEPLANVEALLAAGEGPQIEYKLQLPETAAEKRNAFKTAAAFASFDGGTIVFGVDPDEVTVAGLGDEDPRKLRDRLYDLVHRCVVPAPRVTVTDYRIDGKTILIMEVPPGPEPPYGIAADKGSRDSPEFYVRRGASTYHAQPGELRLAARRRPPADQPSDRRTRFGPW